MALTPWDVRVFVRAAAAAALVLAIAILVTAATDEGGVAWSERAMRTFAFTPGCAAVGAWVVLAAARARGETLALQALGRSDASLAAAAVAGGALVAWAAALTVAAASNLDLSGFFPRAARASAWVWQGGAFVDHSRGLRVDMDGVPAWLPTDASASSAAIPRHGRAAAALAIAAAGLGLPLLAAQALLAGSTRLEGTQRARQIRRGNVTSIAGSVLAVIGSVVVFQAAAAGRVSPLVGVLPPLLLLAFGLEHYRARSW